MDTPPKVRNSAILVHVEGRVQRVGLRRFVEGIAWDLGLTGYVENLKDGSVRIFVQGPESSTEQFKTRIEKAPEPIVVRKFEARKTRHNPLIRNFRIKTGPLATEIQEGFGGMELQFSDYRGEFRNYRGEFREFTKRTDENFNSLNSYFNDYRGEFRSFANRTDQNFSSLNSNFNNYRGEFKQFADRTDENFKTLGDKYGEISEKLAQVLETLQRETAETRREQTRAVDKLSNLIDQYIKMQQESKN